MTATLLHQVPTKSTTSFGPSRPDSLNQTVSSASHLDSAVIYNDSPDTKAALSDDLSGDLKPKARSRMGCFTCRKRKKRCDEGKPVCQACVRLKLDCEYPLPGQERKNRKRKSSFDGANEPAPQAQSRHHPQPASENDISTVPTQVDPSLFPESKPFLKPTVVNTSDTKKLKYLQPAKSASAENKSNQQNDPILMPSGATSSPHGNNIAPSPDFSISHLDSYLESPSQFHGTVSSTTGCESHPIQALRSSENEPDQHYSLHSLIHGGGVSPFSALSPASSGSSGSNHDVSQNVQNYINKMAQVEGPLPDGSHSASTHVHPDLFSSNVEADMLENFRAVLNGRLKGQSPDPGAMSPGAFSPSAVFARGLHSLLSSPKPEQSSRLTEILDDDTQENASKECPSALDKDILFGSSVMDSTALQCTSPSTSFDNPHDHFFVDSMGRDYSFPSLLSTPTPWYAVQLDNFGVEMFNYYRTSLANMICVSSGKLNSFLDVFIPMAQQDTAVLYSLVAYGSFHNDMGKHEQAGVRYLNKAIEMVRQDLSKSKLTTLACILIIVTAEICRGDMLHWDKHLEAAAAVIQMNGGLKNFVGDRTKRWLASNFFYHEILGASKYSRKTHFLANEYDELLKSDIGVHSLIGCCKSIFHLMARLSDLAVESQGIFEKLEDNDETSELFYSSELRSLLTRAKALEAEIDKCKPDPTDIISLSAADQEEQLTVFDTFQLTAKLQLQQSVLRRNAASLNMQVLAADLVESLDVVLNTKVEGILVFPLFMASIMATRPHTRLAMLNRFESFYKRNLARNIVRAKSLAEQVWSLDCNGTKYVNWSSLVQAHGMDICFA